MLVFIFLCVLSSIYYQIYCILHTRAFSNVFYSQFTRQYSCWFVSWDVKIHMYVVLSLFFTSASSLHEAEWECEHFEFQHSKYALQYALWIFVGIYKGFVHTHVCMGALWPFPVLFTRSTPIRSNISFLMKRGWALHSPSLCCSIVIHG